ncbi:hypothetical protein SRABI118_03881 [Massilia sp. Bi118]|uniref:hypothetical protein n=1 Tax=Massilia sp. Bi118 TaxID=2822346 RepID=UPI001D260EE5|nr:hypothetical protein [Massilia sp. Bi118]CAH0284467.1 hypothetical protein SRABI118_03881 [Massilia sp. Bi118]
MATVFIAGSITIKNLDFMVQERLMNIMHMKHDVVVGDADGVDTSIQRFLLDEEYERVTVFCTGETPRNNVGNWPVHPVTTYHKPGSRAFFTAKDIALAEAADTGFMIWDAKSTGTLSNVIELLHRKKYSWVFVNKEKAFHAVKQAQDLENLLSLMSQPARLKADTKIGLIEKLEALHSREIQMALLDERAQAKAAEHD